ncbi:hypothetical protein EMPS_07806 [Entomortierella parvispora]|uniref:Phosphoglycerate mutase-like protein n=1 Tax=Entomortierella parvispora TaxID=205924 RepID=A0A9P3HF80_9FUNG|nr:hypothetical protein EMPS_07806 [Entomortierella parvispora]
MSVAGVIVLTRHGDRQGFYQSPTNYNAVATNLTILGYLEEYQNGQDIRNLYLSGANAIPGLDPNTYYWNELNAMADAGGEGTVIIDSANAFLQGLYPPYNETLTLANGTVISWDRAQSVELETIEINQEIWLEGYAGCSGWTNRLNAWYNSAEFAAQAKIANPFFESLSSILGNRPATLQNAWNLFDFLNVESIHNATLSPLISAQALSQARYWANYHEAGSFTDDDLNNVGNVAGQSILPPILSAINEITNATTGLKFSYIAISYKPFLSLFNLWGLPSPLKDSVVDYASAAIIEIRTDNTMRLLFRNGTETGGSNATFTPYALFGSSDANSYPIADFVEQMEPYSLNTLAEWCNKCGETEQRGCATLAALNGTGGAGYASIDSTEGRHRVSPVVAGVIGAMVALAVAGFVLALWLLKGGLAKKRRGNSLQEVSSVDSHRGTSVNSREGSSSVGTKAGSDHHVDTKEVVSA